MRRPTILLLMVVLVLSACRFASSAAPTAPPTLAPTPSSAVPTLATDNAVQPGNYELTLVNAEDRRDMLVHIPPAYDGESRLPLLIVLHGGAGSAQQVRRAIEMDADADVYGFVVAYLNGSGRLSGTGLTWNAGHCCGYALDNETDDVGMIGVLIDSLLSHYAIDPQRVYITGFSNGGMMAYRAGAELADKVAGIAPVAASLGGQVSADGPLLMPAPPSSPVAVIAFHGMEDQQVLYEGGSSPAAVQDGRIDLSVADSIGFWVAANGCDPQLAATTRGSVIIETYSGCDGDADVMLVSIVQGGHDWPGSQDISANQMMLEFFLEHPKQ